MYDAGSPGDCGVFKPQPVDASGDVFGGRRLRQVACGDHHSVALAEGPLEVFAWGKGEDGRCARFARGVGGICASWVEHGFSLKPHAHEYHGPNRCGQGCEARQLVPRSVAFAAAAVGVEIVEIGAGSDHTLARGSDGRVYAFGLGGQGQLGHGDLANQTLPRPIVLEAVENRGETSAVLCCYPPGA